MGMRLVGIPATLLPCTLALNPRSTQMDLAWFSWVPGHCSWKRVAGNGWEQGDVRRESVRGPLEQTCFETQRQSLTKRYWGHVEKVWGVLSTHTEYQNYEWCLRRSGAICGISSQRLAMFWSRETLQQLASPLKKNRKRKKPISIWEVYQVQMWIGFCRIISNVFKCVPQIHIKCIQMCAISYQFCRIRHMQYRYIYRYISMLLWSSDMLRVSGEAIRWEWPYFDARCQLP